jgi:hypothetical protein
MQRNYSLHAARRAQQRGVPPLIADWLLNYGEEQFDGRGAIVRYFSKRSVRTMERDLEQAPVRRLAEFLRCYLVEASDNGKIITVGRRHQRIRR